jgi:hypothetical protein
VSEVWSKGRAVTRLATAGLAAVLLLLTGFALWASSSTNRAARQADQFNRLSDAYQQARFAVAAEESLERKYRLEPGPEVRQRYQQAAATLGAVRKVWWAVRGLIGSGHGLHRPPFRTRHVISQHEVGWVSRAGACRRSLCRGRPTGHAAPVLAG